MVRYHHSFSSAPRTEVSEKTIPSVFLCPFVLVCIPLISNTIYNVSFVFNLHHLSLTLFPLPSKFCLTIYKFSSFFFILPRSSPPPFHDEIYSITKESTTEITVKDQENICLTRDCRLKQNLLMNRKSQYMIVYVCIDKQSHFR